MSKQKAKGTWLETTCVRWLTQRLGLGPLEIRRAALAGSGDCGDICGLVAANGTTGIIECKNYAAWGPADLLRWRDETAAERMNAHVDWAVLLVKRQGIGYGRFGRTPVYMPIRDMLVLGNVAFQVNRDSDYAGGVWVASDIETVCCLMEGAEAHG